MASAETRVPLVANLSIKEFSGSGISKSASKMVNCSVQKKFAGPEEKLYITQRPAITVLHDASVTIAEEKGRGIYYWATTGAEYIINNATIYKGDYSTTVGTITGGNEKVEFEELGGKLVIIDAENDELWTITSGDVLAQVTDGDLPTTIASGGCQLNGYLFLLDEDGLIWHSDADDPTSWNALNYIEAERENDGGTYITKLYNDIVVLGPKTIEYFYDAGNPVGSILSRREDVFFNLGCIDGQTAWANQDVMYFVGLDRTGRLGVYELDGHNLTLVSNSDIDAYLTNLRFVEGLSFTASGFASPSSKYYILTVYYDGVSGEVIPAQSLIYEADTKLWHIWNTDLASFDSDPGFALIGWSSTSGSDPRYGEGIMYNGDIISFSFQPEAFDGADSSTYVVDDYILTDYLRTLGSGEIAIDMVIRIGELTFGTNNRKFMRRVELVGPYTPEDQDVTIKWSDTDTETFPLSRTINLAERRATSAMGSFSNRCMQVEITSATPVYLEAMEFDIDKGYV